MKRRSILSLCFLAPFVLGTILLSAGTYAESTKENKAFVKWLKRMEATARKKGIKSKTYRAAIAGLKSPDLDVLKKANNQAEFVKPIWEYIDRRVRDERVKQGRELLKKHGKLLEAVEKKYGVDRHIVLAIWGLESNFGSHPGDKYVIHSLATLGYKGKRRRFGRSQMMAALKILQRGDVTPENMKGSWAGAMGHTQFIPTTYNAYAVDFDKDGKRDIWGTIPDALGSTANYLRVSRWRKSQTWGYEVKLPKNFRYHRSYKRRSKTIAQWKKLGIKRISGKAFPRSTDKATLRIPAGIKGPAFLILPNFRSILRYNNSFAYALSVGHLADRLRGAGKFATPWPPHKKFLTQMEQRKELQTRLEQKGYDIGKIDGFIGEKTTAAIRAYQKSKGMSQTGVPTLKLLNSLRK